MVVLDRKPGPMRRVAAVVGLGWMAVVIGLVLAAALTLTIIGAALLLRRAVGG